MPCRLMVIWVIGVSSVVLSEVSYLVFFDISLNDCGGATLLDVSKVQSMYGMFNGAYKFEGKGLDMWKTNSVIDTQWMFYGDEYGNKGYLFDSDLSGKQKVDD